MKKLAFCLTLVILTMTFHPLQVNASSASTPVPTEAIPTTESVEAAAMIARLESIQKMDIANMSRTEKKALRQEVHAIKDHLKKSSGGVYLSVGAIIIILLILLLLL